MSPSESASDASRKRDNCSEVVTRLVHSCLEKGKPLLRKTSAYTALAILFFGQIVFWHDSAFWTEYADSFFNPQRFLHSWPLYSRDPAYAFLICLTGYGVFHNVGGVLILQALMAALSPLLVCLTLEPLSHRMGLIAGWIALLSGIPFVFQTEIFTDQLYMFLLLLLALAGVRCSLTGHTSSLYGAAITVGILSFCRPTFWALLPLAVIVIAVWGRCRYRLGIPFSAHCATALALLASLFAANLCVRSWQAPEVDPPVHSIAAGYYLMRNLHRYTEGVQGALNANDGPATREFRQKMVAAFEYCGLHNGGYVNCLDPYVQNKLRAAGQLTQASRSAEATVDTYFYYPRYLQARFMKPVADEYRQSKEGQLPLIRVYFEQMTHHPVIAVHMLEGAFDELVFASYYKYVLNDDYGYQAELYGKLIPGIPFLSIPMLQPLFEVIFRLITITTGVLFITGAYFYVRVLWKREDPVVVKDAMAFFFLFLIYWLPNGAMIPMIMMQFRYCACTALLPLMGAAIFVRRLWIRANINQ